MSDDDTEHVCQACDNLAVGYCPDDCCWYCAEHYLARATNGNDL